MKKVICLYGGPGAGKSTTCAGLFYKLKLLGYNVEMNREYVKDWCWENRPIKQGDQVYLFAKQSRKERILLEKQLDFIITDNPLVLAHFYGLKYDIFERKSKACLHLLNYHHDVCKHYGYKVDHFLINRVKPYQAAGRYQTEEEAKQFDIEIKALLDELQIKYNEVPGDETAVDKILNIALGDST